MGDYYAACLQEHLPADTTALFGPAYKGIPLAVSAAASLYRNYGRDLPYCFNRKEVKDHGEGGFMVGYQPQAGDVIAIVEDVVTAGTAVRESIALFEKVAPVKISSLFVSVDRMERGSGSCSTLDELRQEYGIAVHPIVTVRDIIDFLYERPIDGKVYIDQAMKERMAWESTRRCSSICCHRSPAGITLTAPPPATCCGTPWITLTGSAPTSSARGTRWLIYCA